MSDICIRFVAYEDRQSNFIFVAVPNDRGRYVRTSKVVALAECPACGSIKGEPCKFRQGYSGGTHADRHTAAGSRRGRPMYVDDVIDSLATKIEHGSLEKWEAK